MKPFTDGNPIYHTYIAFLYNKIKLLGDEFEFPNGCVMLIKEKTYMCGNTIIKYNNTKTRKENNDETTRS